jgi:hypothetical protein
MGSGACEILRLTDPLHRIRAVDALCAGEMFIDEADL